jgi:hypothetical protein
MTEVLFYYQDPSHEWAVIAKGVVFQNDDVAREVLTNYCVAREVLGTDISDAKILHGAYVSARRIPIPEESPSKRIRNGKL